MGRGEAVDVGRGQDIGLEEAAELCFDSLIGGWRKGKPHSIVAFLNLLLGGPLEQKPARSP